MRRILWTCALFLALGALLNVIVAWGCALSIDVFEGLKIEQGSAITPEGTWYVYRYQRRGAVWFDSTHTQGGELPEGASGAPPATLVHGWSGFATPTPSAIVDMRTGDARGWPALSLWYEVRRQSYMTEGGWLEQGVRGGIETPLAPWTLGNRSFPRVMPLRPIWTGCAANTALYGVVLWLVVRGPRTVRRYDRRRRGRCLSCGYDLGHVKHDVCPECGTA